MTPERYRRLQVTLDRRQPDLTVIMEGIHKPHNIAAILRTCDAVGIGDVHAARHRHPTHTPACTARGSQRWVQLHRHDSGLAAIDVAQQQGMQVLAAHFSDTARPYREVNFTQPTALLLGTEKFGVTEEALAAVDGQVIIPMMGMVESFNVSVAAAIILSEVCEQRRSAGFYRQCRLDDAQYARLLFRWAHPRVAGYCERFGVPIPALDEQGRIVNDKAFNYRLSEAVRRREYQ